MVVERCGGYLNYISMPASLLDDLFIVMEAEALHQKKQTAGKAQKRG